MNGIKNVIRQVKAGVVLLVGIILVVFTAARATTVMATERARGPLVVRLNNQTCAFVPRGRTISAKRIDAGVEPVKFVVLHKRRLTGESLSLLVRLGVAPNAKSDELCRYLEFRLENVQARKIARAEGVKILAQLTASELLRFQHSASDIEQAAFIGYARALFVEYTRKYGLSVTFARFERRLK